jgi:predicted nucleic acid-binding protein
MSDVVVDCSVAVKWFVPEDHSDLASGLLNSDKQLHAPAVLMSEFANTLWKLVRRGLLPPDDALGIAGAMGVVDLTIHPNDGLTVPALTMALAANHPAYDCFYLALALNLNGHCVTADRRFYDAFADRYSDTMVWIENVQSPPPDEPISD